MHNYTSISASVAGASGYSGAELLRLLSRHPAVRLNKVYANTQAGMRVDALIPSLARVVDLSFLPVEALAEDDSDVLLLALPHAEAMKRLPTLTGTRRIIDLSGDFRLRDTDRYREYYGLAHTAADLLPHAVYGLPETNAPRIASARIVANPGCYATCAALALAPLASHGLLPRSVSVIAYSGVSGAGRSPSATTHFAEANESVRAYKVGTHQHTPEIEQTLSDIAGRPVAVTFIPHLLPVTRGIHATTTMACPDGRSLASIKEMYAAYYAHAPFVRLLDAPPNMKDVAHTNYCDIHLALDAHSNTLVVLATLDNLLKGAAGQAVQNLNLMFGFHETEGLYF